MLTKDLAMRTFILLGSGSIEFGHPIIIPRNWTDTNFCLDDDIIGCGGFLDSHYKDFFKSDIVVLYHK